MHILFCAHCGDHRKPAGNLQSQSANLEEKKKGFHPYSAKRTVTSYYYILSSSIFQSPVICTLARQRVCFWLCVCMTVTAASLLCVFVHPIQMRLRKWRNGERERGKRTTITHLHIKCILILNALLDFFFVRTNNTTTTKNVRISGFRGKELTEAEASFCTCPVRWAAAAALCRWYCAIILPPDGSAVKCPLLSFFFSAALWDSG